MHLYKNLNHISITVTDLEATRAFYEGQLGLKTIPRPDFGFPGVWYGLDGDLSLHIITAKDAPFTERQKTTFDLRQAHFALWTDDCDETHERLVGLGVKVNDLVSTPTGLRQLFVKDPDGNLVEFIGPTKAARVRRMET
jgi:catechol 2,3-dioxygenase-like lactoylglutathione lyase family enzyme